MIRHLRRALPYAWITFWFLLSATPGEDLPAISHVPHLDKVVHATSFMILICLFALAGKRERGEWMPHAIGAAVMFAILDELHQTRVPGRSPSVLDALADLTGVGLGILLTSVRWSDVWRCRILR